jgi:RHS repeat-associated protein
MMRTVQNMVKNGSPFVALALFVVHVAAQTTNYSIPAGSGTLTYTGTVAETGTCPIGSPSGPQDPIVDTTFNAFYFNGTALSGSIVYRASPGGTYCPTSGWQGPIPMPLSGSNYEVFFTPSLGGNGTATLDAITVGASQSPDTWGSSLTLYATEAYPESSGTVTFYDGSTTLGTSAMSNSAATFTTSSLSVGSHSLSVTYVGNAPTVTSPVTILTVNQAPQAISFATISSPRTYGVGAIALSATGGSSGNGVVFSVLSGPASVSGTTLTISGAGTIVVAANQAGNTDYSSAPQVTQSITVNKAVLTVTANNASRPYGSSNPAFTPTYSGFVNGDTASVLSGAPSLTTSATSSSAAGSYAINAASGSLSAANYTFNFVNGTLTVGKIVLTVTANSTSKVYGAALPSLTASYAGFVNGDTTSVLSGSPSLTTSATAGSSVGSYTITSAVGTLSATSYSFAFANGSLNVNKAPLTATATNASRVYGIANPTFAANYSGFVNGDTSSVLSGAPSLTTTASVSSVVGSYTITAAAGTLTATNYSLSYVNGTLTITIATPSVTWPNPSAVPNGSYLSPTQLNATTSVAGSFAYTPASGTQLTAGVHQLSTTFTPSDTTDYKSTTVSVSLAVTLAPATGIITTVAGNNTSGYVGNPLTATSAEFNEPGAVALDSSGNLYVADSVNNVVRKVTASTGMVSTIAGTTTAGFSGDTGPAITATLNSPLGVAVDAQGNIYIADTMNYVIRKVTPGGTITTVAGQGGKAGYSGDTGAATSALLKVPWGVGVDTAGNIYIADTQNNVVRKVTVATGIITTVAGSSSATSLGDGGAATSAQMAWPTGVAIDSSNNIYIADSDESRVRKVTASTGIISTVAGNGNWGYGGDGGAATLATLNYPIDVAVDAGGNLFIADANNNLIRKVGPSGIISSAGNDVAGFSGDGGEAILAELQRPAGVAVDAADDIFIADSLNSNIRAVGGGPITPPLNWVVPNAIVYGTQLGPNQLNASSSVAGTFTYSPAAGATVHAGQQTLTVTFAPADTTDYTTASASVPLTVTQAIPELTWAIPAAITDSTALSATQLNAAAPSGVLGTFTYTPASGTTLTAGTHLLTATFVPQDTTDYLPASTYTAIDVNTGSKQDSGTFELWINNTVAASTNYSSGATTSSIAEGLAANVVPGAPVKLYANDDEVSIVATTSTAATNYAYSFVTSVWDSTDFPSPSFSVPSGYLSGGSAGSGTQQTIYSYNVPSNGYDAASNLVNYTDSTVMGTWSFTYDTLNRLSGASTNQTGNLTPYYCWNYDIYGNRWQQESSNLAFQSGSGGPSACSPQTSGTVSTQLTSFGGNNNQVTSTNARGVTAIPGYDPDGNMTSDGANTYLYDAEDRVCAVASPNILGFTTFTGYIYNAEGTRVSKGTIQAWSCDPTISKFSPTNDYILGPGGEQLTEYAMDTTGGTNTMAWQHTNVWAGGKLIATDDAVGTHFYLDDPLGTRRVQTDYAGNVEHDCSSLPFGDGESCAPTPTEHLFTGKERDTESGNDYFGARYYASSMGRFSSPDPSQLYYADPSNPQSFNLYSYVLNNPLVNVDPDGLKCFQVDSDGNLTGGSNAGDCATDANGNPTNNDIYVDDEQASNAFLDSNGDLLGYTNGSGQQVGADGNPFYDAGTLNGNGSGTPLNDIDTEISPFAMQFIQDVNQDDQHKIGCIAQAFFGGSVGAGTGGTGNVLSNLSAPIAKSKAGGALGGGTTRFTSQAAAMARDSGLSNFALHWKAPVADAAAPFGFAMKRSPNLGVWAGRMAPVAGKALQGASIAATAYSAYNLWNCY